MYQSTRSPEEKATAKEAVLQGIAPDGGLYVLPDLKEKQVDLDKVLAQSYMENAVMILDLLLEDYSREELEQIVHKAYTGKFDDLLLTPVADAGSLHVLELFHGPTSAFKDMALTMLPHLMQKALEGTGAKALVLTATSGDTGKAALSGFADVPGTGILVFYPHQAVSDMQYRQMACQPGSNLDVFALKGNFDDAQTKVKELFLDQELKDQLEKRGIRLTSANSINVGRLVPQVVYYFEAWKQLVHAGKITKDTKLTFSVPTGNFGDVLAGWYAKQLGLPVHRFIVSSNANDVLTDFIRTGTYDRMRPFKKTISPSMDILVSSNLERLLYDLSGQDTAKVAAWMDQLKREGSYTVDDNTLSALQANFTCASLDDAATKDVIRETYEQTGYVLDPHTAVGYGAAKALQEDGEEIVVLGTASPYKFSQDVLEALGESQPDAFSAARRLEEKTSTTAPAPLKALEKAPILHKDVIGPEDMKERVAAFAGSLA